MSYEEMQRTMQFILEQQAQFSANMGQVQESISQLTAGQKELAAGQKELAAGQKELAAAQSRTNATVDRLALQVEQIARQQVHINEVVAVIAESQQHTDERLNALIEIVREGRNGAA
jgi:X-X-X-Leu-X-X-Gly heptad repeat protein